MKPEEKNKTDLPTQLKVANRSGLEAETLSRGLRLAAGGAKRPPRGFQRAQPLAYLCLLSLREKVGRGAEHGKAMLSRSARMVGAGAASPA